MIIDLLITASVGLFCLSLGAGIPLAVVHFTKN